MAQLEVTSTDCWDARRVVALATLLFVALAGGPAEAGESARELCEDAFDESWRRSKRGELERKVELLGRAATLGHLPSQYHLAAYFGENARKLDPPLTGLPDDEERRQLLQTLAEATFPPAEYAVAFRAKDEGFFPTSRSSADSDAAARKRWEFFTWMTRSALHGHRLAWEALSEFYPIQIERFDGSRDDRVRGYAWAHLRAIPVHSFEKGPIQEVWSKREREAWKRLRDATEQAFARDLADRYEKEVFPKLLRDLSPKGICAMDPQFAGPETAARTIAEPLGPRPAPRPRPATERPPPPPLPVAPDGIFVISKEVRTDQDVEYGRHQRLRIGEVPVERAGILERAICRIHDAPIFEQGGILSVHVSVDHVDGKSTPLCSLVPRGPFGSDRPLRARGIRMEGGDVVTFSCRSFAGKRKRGPPGGCSVDVAVWVKPDAAESGPTP